MGTQCTIAIQKNTKSAVNFKTVCVHWDGYLSWVGQVLLDAYNTAEKVEELISLGCLSSLGRNIKPNPDKPHSFMNPQKDVCVFYHRDRGELWKDVNPAQLTLTSSLELAEEKYIGYISRTPFTRYNYLFKDGQWYWKKKADKEWKLLTQADIDAEKEKK